MLLMPLHFGLYGIIYAGLVADLVAATVVFFFIRKEMTRLHTLIA